jgi:hypothetical protein
MCIPLESNQRPYDSEPLVLPTELVVFNMKSLLPIVHSNMGSFNKVYSFCHQFKRS